MIRKLLPPDFQENVTIKTALEYFDYQCSLVDSPWFLFTVKFCKNLISAALAYDSFTNLGGFYARNYGTKSITK